MFHVRSLTVAATIACTLALGGCQGTDVVSGIATRPAAPSTNGFAMLEGTNIYHYYPEQQVYYSPDRELYYFYGAGFWTVSKAIPSTYELDKSQRLLIGLDSDKPYREHLMVVATLSGRELPGTNPFDRSGSAVATVPTD